MPVPWWLLVLHSVRIGLSKRSIGLSTPWSRCRDPRRGPILVGRSVGIHKASGPLGRKHKRERLCNNMASPLREPHTGTRDLLRGLDRLPTLERGCSQRHVENSQEAEHEALRMITWLYPIKHTQSYNTVSRDTSGRVCAIVTCVRSAFILYKCSVSYI